MLKKYVLIPLFIFSFHACNKQVEKSLIPLLGLLGLSNNNNSGVEYNIGGSVSGLQGEGLTLQNNGGDDLSISADGTFTFSTKIKSGNSYEVTISSQPTNPSQNCSVTDGSGTVADSDITGVAVNCSNLSEYSVVVNVTGFALPFVVQINGGNDLNISANGGHTFPTKLTTGSNYSVSIVSQPTGQICTIPSPTGTIGSSDVAIDVNCVDAYTVGGNITNLTGSGFQLAMSGDISQTLAIPAGTANYTFPTSIPTGSNITVSIVNQPTSPWQTCSVSNGGPVTVTSDISNVDVSCTTNTYTVAASIIGYSGTTDLVLQNNSADDMNVNLNAGYTFPTQIESGNPYNVTVLTQPTNPWQTCTVTNGSGTITNSNVMAIVTCVTNQYFVAGTINGYIGDSLSISDGTNTQNITAGSTSFAFPLTDSGTAYNVTITNRPANPVQNCTVTNPNGTITNANISDVVIDCTNVVLAVPSITDAIGLTNEVTLIANTLAAPDDTIPQTLCYTTDGSIPTCSAIYSGICGAGSTEYTAPFSINTPSTVVSYISCSSGYENSVVGSRSYPLGSVGTPTFSFPPGTYDNNIALTISSTDATTIYYTTDGTVPTCAGGGTSIAGAGPTTGSIAVTPTTNSINAIGCANGYSSVSNSGVYAFTVADPSLNPIPPANITAGTTVTFASTTTGAYFCHSDSTIPSCGGASTCATGTLGDYTYPGSSSKTLNVIACKDGYNSSNVISGVYSPLTYTVGGTISGLTIPFGADTFQIQNNAGDTLTIAANGSFTFPTGVADGTSYNVTVSSQPQNPWQTCTVTNGSGTVSGANVTNVDITCTVDQHKVVVNITTPSSYVTDGLIIENEDGTYGTLNPIGDDPTNQAFTLQDSGSTYAISITEQPDGLDGIVCAFEDIPGGTIEDADVVINMRCVEGYTAGGRVQKLPIWPLTIPLYQGVVTTVAGSTSGTSGSSDGNGTSASFNNPTDIVALGDYLYVVDKDNNLIRRINISTYNVDTFAGGGAGGTCAGVASTNCNDGIGTAAKFNQPTGITTDGISLYVTDTGNNLIRKIVVSTTQVTTIAGNGTAAFADNVDPLQSSFHSPNGITTNGNKLFIADSDNHRIRVMDLATREVTTLAGSVSGFSDGVIGSALFSYPRDIEIAERLLFITDNGNNRIRVIDLSANTVATAAGGNTQASIDGRFAENYLYSPTGVMVDGSSIYFTESDVVGSHRLRRVHAGIFHVTTIAGSNSTGNTDDKGLNAEFNEPGGITSDGRSIYVAGGKGNNIRKINDYRLEAYHGYWGPDYSLNENNGTMNNMASTFGRYNEEDGAGLYNGINANVTAADTGLPTGSAERTLCAWVKPTNLPGNNSISTILRYGGAANGSAIGLRNIAGRHKIAFTDTGNPGNDVIANYTLPTGTWSHICGVYDGIRAKLYMNGHLLGTQTGTWNTTLGSGTIIGSQAGNINYFDGAIIDTRIYSRALNEAEINMFAQEADNALVDVSYNLEGQNLLLHYTFDDGNVNDSGPLGVNGTTSGSPSLTVDVNGNANSAYSFNGSGQYLQASSSEVLLGNKPRTVCAWVRLSFPPFSGGYSIVSLGSSGNDTTIGVYNDAGTDQVVMYGHGDTLAFNYSVPSSKWTHICGVYKPGTSNGTMQLFVNGIEFSNGTTSTNWNTTASQVYIGRHVSGGGFFPGVVDDVRVYDIPLKAWQIRLLSSQVRSGLVAKYGMTGGVYDESGFANNGTAENGATLTTDRFGVPTTAYLIDKNTATPPSDEKIGVPDSPVQSTESISITAWLKPTQDPPVGGGISIVEKVSAATPPGQGGYLLAYENYSGNELVWAVDGSAVLNVSTTLSTGSYNHIAITQKGTNASLYVNGSLVGSTNSATLFPSSNSNSLCIGCGPQSNFQNAIDDVRIYNRELTLEEIQAIGQ